MALIAGRQRGGTVFYLWRTPTTPTGFWTTVPVQAAQFDDESVAREACLDAGFTAETLAAMVFLPLPLEGGWWLSSVRMTFSVDVNSAGRITRAAPVAQTFVGDPLIRLIDWMRGHGDGFRMERLPDTEGAAKEVLR